VAVVADNGLQILSEVRALRKENKDEHKTITKTLNAHSVKLACLETKWSTFWKVLKWAAPIMGIVIGAAVGVNWLIQGG
jgi:hypothetical protein